MSGLADGLRSIAQSSSLDQTQLATIRAAILKDEELDRGKEFLDSIYEVAKACEPYCSERDVMKAAIELIMQMACVVP